MTCSVSVGHRYEKLSEYLVTIGRYENRSEVFRDAMRLLEEREYALGYIYREEEWAVLMSAHAQLNNAEREIDFPRRSIKNPITKQRRPEVISYAKDFVEERIDTEAKSRPKERPARFDPPPQSETAKGPQKRGKFVAKRRGT
jgi:putative addiction module CopG family antidote